MKTTNWLSQINPNFAYPYVRIAALFETQKQWDLVLENLNKAIQVDPSFSLAYYELFYYYFFAKQDYAQAEATLNKYIGTRANEDKTEDDYMYSQLCWAKKDWDCAITKAEGVKAAMGAKVKPRVYKQLAYSYLGKGDFANAKTNIDEFFAREKEGFSACRLPVESRYLYRWWRNLRRSICIIYARSSCGYCSSIKDRFYDESSRLL